MGKSNKTVTQRLASAIAKAKAPGGNVAKNNTKKKYVRTTEPAVGEIVKFHSFHIGATGGLGIVVGWLDENTVLVKTFGGGDEDYPKMFLSMDTRKPNQHYHDPHGNWHRKIHYGNYLTGIVEVPGVSPKRRKKVKKAKVQFVVQDDQVLDVLTGKIDVPDGHEVVLASDSPVGEVLAEALAIAAAAAEARTATAHEVEEVTT